MRRLPTQWGPRQKLVGCAQGQGKGLLTQARLAFSPIFGAQRKRLNTAVRPIGKCKNYKGRGGRKNISVRLQKLFSHYYQRYSFHLGLRLL